MDQNEQESVGGGNAEPLRAGTASTTADVPLPCVYNPRRASREVTEALVTWACRGGSIEELAPLAARIRQECLLVWKPTTVGSVELPMLDESSVRPLSDAELRAIAVELTERAEALGALASIVMLGTSRQPFELSLWAQHKGPGLAVLGLLNSGTLVLHRSLQPSVQPPTPGSST